MINGLYSHKGGCWSVIIGTTKFRLYDCIKKSEVLSPGTSGFMGAFMIMIFYMKANSFGMINRGNIHYYKE